MIFNLMLITIVDIIIIIIITMFLFLFICTTSILIVDIMDTTYLHLHLRLHRRLRRQHNRSGQTHSIGSRWCRKLSSECLQRGRQMLFLLLFLMFVLTWILHDRRKVIGTLSPWCQISRR